MSENLSSARRVVGYALNVFPYETLDELWACLKGDVLAIKERAFPDAVFPIELRFSERIVRELTCDEVSRLKYFLDTHDLALVTINGFVMPEFHGERVKERVYLPAWHESEARLQFTKECLDLLPQLAPPDCERLSVSVPFGALKPVTMEAVAPNILKAGQHAAAKDCIIALEPEPGLCVETTDEVIEFFTRFVPDELRSHMAVNFDLSHQLVQFENLTDSITRLQRAGITIAKIHVSNAAEMAELKPFFDDSIYLHQVCGADASGKRAYFSLDWPSMPPSGVVKFRIHYHLPLFTSENSTQREVEQFLTNLPILHPSTPFIIETYTHRERLVENICRELAWVREKISLSRS